MNNSPEKVSAAREALVQMKLNACEQLQVAEGLVGSVVDALLPLHDPALCVGQGRLEAAMEQIENGRSIIDGMMDADDLPVPGL